MDLLSEGWFGNKEADNSRSETGLKRQERIGSGEIRLRSKYIS